MTPAKLLRIILLVCATWGLKALALRKWGLEPVAAVTTGSDPDAEEEPEGE